MNSFTFTLIVKNLDIESAEQANQLDWTKADFYASQIDGQTTLTVASAVEVENRVEFALDAMAFLNGLNPTIEVLAVAPDLVGTSDIAFRAGIDRETIRTWANASRGSGDFPTPLARLGGERKIWDWPTVNQWLKEHNRLDSTEVGLSRDEFSRLDSLLRARAGRRSDVFDTSRFTVRPRPASTTVADADQSDPVTLAEAMSALFVTLDFAVTTEITSHGLMKPQERTRDIPHVSAFTNQSYFSSSNNFQLAA